MHLMHLKIAFKSIYPSYTLSIILSFNLGTPIFSLRIDTSGVPILDECCGGGIEKWSFGILTPLFFFFITLTLFSSSLCFLPHSFILSSQFLYPPHRSFWRSLCPSLQLFGTTPPSTLSYHHFVMMWKICFPQSLWPSLIFTSFSHFWILLQQFHITLKHGV